MNHLSRKMMNASWYDAAMNRGWYTDTADFGACTSIINVFRCQRTTTINTYFADPDYRENRHRS